MPKARYAPTASDVESPRGGEDEEHGEGETAPRSRLGQSVLVVLIVMLAGFGGTAGALWYGETQLTALQASLERQRAKTEEVLAQHVSALQGSVLAYDKHKPGWGDHPTVDKPLPHVQPVGESTLREACDVVSLHLPWTQETSGLVDGPWLQSWQKPLILLNTSRGGIVQSKALVEALEKGTVLAAGLDVLEHEARSLESMGASNHEQRQTLEALLCDDRVMITPHVAGWTQESLVRLSTVLADKILAQGKT